MTGDHSDRTMENSEKKINVKNNVVHQSYIYEKKNDGYVSKIGRYKYYQLFDIHVTYFVIHVSKKTT